VSGLAGHPAVFAPSVRLSSLTFILSVRLESLTHLEWYHGH